MLIFIISILLVLIVSPFFIGVKKTFSQCLYILLIPLFLLIILTAIIFMSNKDYNNWLNRANNK